MLKDVCLKVHTVRFRQKWHVRLKCLSIGLYLPENKNGHVLLPIFSVHTMHHVATALSDTLLATSLRCSDKKKGTDPRGTDLWFCLDRAGA